MNLHYIPLPHTPMPTITPEELHDKAQEFFDALRNDNELRTITVDNHIFTLVKLDCSYDGYQHSITKMVLTCGTLEWDITALNSNVQSLSLRNDVQYLPIHTREECNPNPVTTTLAEWCQKYGKATLEEVEEVLGVADGDTVVCWSNHVLIVGQSSIDAIDPMPTIDSNDFLGFEYSHENLPCLWDFQGEFAVTIDGNIIEVWGMTADEVDEHGQDYEHHYYRIIEETNVTPDRVWASFRSAKG